jgi:hypothetical protein
MEPHKMVERVYQKVMSTEQINAYCQSIQQLIQGEREDEDLCLVKQSGWIAVCAEDDSRYYGEENFSRFASAFQKHGSDQFIALSWSQQPPHALIVPSTLEGFSQFAMQSNMWDVLFPHTLDWLFLIAPTMDLIIVAGPPDFVQDLFGCNVREVFNDILDRSESKYLHPTYCRYLKSLVQKLEVEYPKLKHGDKLDLSFPEVPEEENLWKSPRF